MKERISRKMIFTCISILTHCIIAGFFIYCGVFDAGLWGIWFGSFSGGIAVYQGVNVWQKANSKEPTPGDGT